MIYRHLSASVLKSVHDAKLLGNNNPRSRKRIKLESKGPDSETQTDIPNKRNTRPRYHTEPLTSVKHILRQLHHSKHHTVSNHEAALRLEPSATLIASIVHLALLRLRTGIASFHLTTWASNGSYPFFLNAFAHLPPRLRKRMGPIRRTFGDGAVPHPAQIDWTTDLLILARVREAAAE